ncbi:hypothetical protein H0H92_012379 [Tricholoma furcatifolium]|nr:hypothetical protein H0H92_012379 [Tricholoma furcatifolium]
MAAHLRFPIPRSSNHLIPDLAISWSGVLVFETLIFVLTVYKSFTFRRTRLGRIGLFALLLRDADRVTSIMISRLMLNLRDPRITGVNNDENEVIPLEPRQPIKTVDIVYIPEADRQDYRKTRHELDRVHREFWDFK